MITQESLSKGWILSFRDRYKKLDPGLLDKMIHALSLVEALKTGGLDQNEWRRHDGECPID